MQRIGILAILLSSVPLYGQDFRGKGREFKEFMQDTPRATMQEVGVISTPLPDKRGFVVPGRWWPVKMIDDTSVYIVKDAHHFLHPDLNDPARSDYILWKSMRGEDPEILLWNCPAEDGRIARIAELERLDQERQARSEKRRVEVLQNRIKREKEVKQRVNARKKEPVEGFAKKFAASKVGHEALLGMQQHIAEAVVDRITNALSSGQATTFSNNESNDDIMRQHIMAAMALQVQMRDIEWCDAIQKDLVPDMWNDQKLRDNALQSANPKTVISWLHREIERQIERVEHRVYYDEENRHDPEIRRENE